MMKRYLIAVAVVLGLCTACSDEEVFYDPEVTGQTYYPLEKGNFWIYNVTDITFQENKGVTTQYDIKELIDTIIVDQTGKSWYQVSISRRAEGSATWTEQSIKLISRTNTDLRINQNNQTKVAMIFPVKNMASWDMNPFIAADTALAQYEKVGEPFNENGLSFNKTATITYANTSNLIVEDQRYDVFATGIGPVYRYSSVLNYCAGGSSSSCQVGEYYITNGQKKIEVLESSGQED